jgi:DNA repair exonuclease SbcCD ATPase subunit
MKNFFSVGNTPIEIMLNSHKKTAIFGTNGSGKSSCVLDSVCYALYGKPFRKANKPNIINSKNKSNMLVEMFFEIGDKNYKISRGMKPNIFEIYCDGKLLNQDASSKDYQDYLEKYILKVNYKSFINVVILGSARYNPFMQMTASDRRNVVEDLLDIQIFSTMNILVKDKLSKLKEELQSIEYNIDVTQEKILLQEQNLLEQQQNKQEQIEKKKTEIEKYNNQIKKIENDITLIQKHIVVLQVKISDKQKVDSRKQKLIAYESKLETNLAKLKKEFQFYESNDNCPTCKQAIDPEFKTGQLNINKFSTDKFNDGMSKLEQEMDHVLSRIKEIDIVIKNIQDHQSEIVKLNASIAAVQKYIQKELNEISTFVKLESDVSNNRLNGLKASLGGFTQEKNNIEEKKRYYEFSSILLKDGGIKTRIIKQYLPIINKLINVYLSNMNFFVNFNIDENFNEVIKSRHRDIYSYENFSEGEKLKIDLAILFAFRQIAKMKNSVNTNLLIMDEILDSSLDEESCGLFLESINKMDDTNIFIISHKGDQISPDKFDRILKFEKKKDFTRLTEIV